MEFNHIGLQTLLDQTKIAPFENDWWYQTEMYTVLYKHVYVL